MEANQSIKSSLTYSGLSAEKEQAVQEFYQGFLKRCGTAHEEGLHFEFDFRMVVNSAPPPDETTFAGEKRELEAKHAQILANIERARTEDMQAVEERHQRGQAEAQRKGYAMGYAFADQKWKPVHQAVCEELELVRREGANHQDAYIRLIAERDEAILAQADLKQELDDMAEGSQELEAQIEALRMELASANGNLEGTGIAARAATASATQVIEGLRKELTSTKTDLIRAQDSAKNLKGEVDAATQLFQAMRSDLERLNAENKGLLEQIEEDKQMVQRHLKEIAKEHAKMTAWEKGEIERLRKVNETLLELVGPTQKLMTSNPELFGGEARGTSSPKPPPIVRLKEEVSEEGKERAVNFLKELVRPFRAPVEAEGAGEGLCVALTEEQYQAMPKAEAPPLPSSPPPSPILVPDQPTECGVGGCIDCPAVEPVAKPVAKPKPNYNHPNWPSPTTKRFARHLATHSGFRSPWLSQDPKTIRTHQDALEYIAKRSNISVETLLQWTMKHYQSFSEPWTLVEGPSKFHMGTAPPTWWR